MLLSHRNYPSMPVDHAAAPRNCKIPDKVKQVLFPTVGDYHQGVQVMPLWGEALVTCAQTRKARLAELLVG